MPRVPQDEDAQRALAADVRFYIERIGLTALLACGHAKRLNDFMRVAEMVGDSLPVVQARSEPTGLRRVSHGATRQVPFPLTRLAPAELVEAVRNRPRVAWPAASDDVTPDEPLTPAFDDAEDVVAAARP